MSTDDCAGEEDRLVAPLNLVIGLTSVILAAMLWSSRQL
jgi:hypothetical protein